MRYLALILCFIISNASAMDDSLMKSIEVSAHGSKFQSERLKISAENLANENSVGTEPGEEPYRRKVIYGKNAYDKRLKTRLLRVGRYDYDNSPFKLKYDPNHPAADENGYIKLPNVSKIIERADASEAQRSFEANLSMIEVSKQMINKTLEAMR